MRLRLCIWPLLGVAALAGFGCREREPGPVHNTNLGTADQPLLPTPLTQYDPAVAKSNKRVEIPKRPGPGESLPEPEPAAPEAPVDAADAGTAGLEPAEVSTVGTPGLPDAGTPGLPEDAGTPGAGAEEPEPEPGEDAGTPGEQP